MGLARKIVPLIIILMLVVIINGKFFFLNKANIFLFIYGITITCLTLGMVTIRYSFYRDPSRIIRTKKKYKDFKFKHPMVSCIFAVYNDEDVVEACIDSLLKSSYKNKEIIVVNDKSTDGTMKILSKYQSNPQVKILTMKERSGKKKAIAEGIKIAKGEIFVFTDSDSVVYPDAIERIVEIFEVFPDVGAVSGHGRALNSQENILTKIQDSWYETQFSVKKAFESVFGAVTCVSGPLAVFRREAVYNYIPAWINDTFLGEEFKFATDRQLTGYVLGSRYIGKKLKAKYANSEFVRGVRYPERDWKIVYSQSARVLTTLPNTFKKVIRQQVRWKKSFIRNLFFTGKFYWRKPLPTALRYYLAAMFTIVGPFIAIRHLVYLPIKGNYVSPFLYLGGILLVGSFYAIAFKIEDPKSRLWVYRPLMSVFSTLVLSWLIFYSAMTIKKQVWHRG